MSKITVLNGFDEADPRLNMPITITRANGVNSTRWKPIDTTLGAAIRMFTDHKEMAHKNGHAVVLGDCVEGPRRATAVKSLSFLALDIDSGVGRDALVERVIASGHMAVIHTTHSHGSTSRKVLCDALVQWAIANGRSEEITDGLVQAYLARSMVEEVATTAQITAKADETAGPTLIVSHSPVSKFRVLFPFKERFVLAEQGALQRDGINAYPALPRAMSEILAVMHDRAAEDVARGFYLPSHAPGAAFESIVVGGDLLDWRTLLPSGPNGGLRATNSPTTTAGKVLSSWAKAKAEGFQMADVIEEFAPERVRDRIGLGLVIECPHDHRHSNPGDANDMACLAMNAGDGSKTSRFAIRCQHHSCADLTSLDHLGAMIDAQWFPAAVLMDDDFNALIETSAPMPPIPLTREASTEMVETAIRNILCTDLGELEKARALKEARQQAQVAAADFKLIEKRVRREMTPSAEPATAPISATEATRLHGQFPLPSPSHGDFSMRQFDGRPWVYLDRGDGPVRLWTPWTIVAGTQHVDQAGKRGLRIAALDEDGNTSQFDVSARDIFSAFGGEFRMRLREAGVGMTEAGEAQCVRLAREIAPSSPIAIFDHGGWRDEGLFLSPWGSTPKGVNRPVEMAHESMPSGEEQCGTLDGWTAATAAAWGTDVLQFRVAPLISFASVLVDMCGQDSFFVAWSSRTSRGKSTSAKLQAAVWGSTKARAGLYGPLNGTDNAVEARFAMGTGAGYAFDETNLVDGGKLQLMIYKGSGNAGNDRLTRSASLRKARTWRGMYTLTGEHEIMGKIRSAGVAATTGLGARVVEIDCEATSPLPRETMDGIEAAFQNTGHAGLAFVSSVIAQGLNRERDEFWQDVEHKAVEIAGDGAPPAVVRAARIAALLWFAGKIAQTAGLIPSDNDLGLGQSLDETIAEFWRRAQESSLTPANSEDVTIQTLFETLLRGRGGRVPDDVSGGFGKADAWRLDAHRTKFGEDAYVVPMSSLKELSGGALNPKALAGQLRARGHLITYRRADGEERTAFDYVPGLGKVSSVVIRASAVEGDGVMLPLAA